MAAIRSHVLPVGPPVPRRRQIGREGDIARLAEQLRNGEHTVLADRRRAGKTTVALGALDVLASDGWTVVGLDLSEADEGGPVLAEGMVAQVALQEARAERGEGFGYEIWDLLRPAGGADERDGDAIDDALTSLRSSGSAGEQLTWALDFATSTGRGEAGIVLFLDEIQRLEYWPDHDAVAAEISGRLRQPGAAITFLFAGSEPSLVESLFADGGLLEFDAVEFHLSPIDAQPWREGLRKAFRELALEINDDAVAAILDASAGEPHRTMLAANRTAEMAQFAEVKVADAATAEAGVAAARETRLWNVGR